MKSYQLNSLPPAIANNFACVRCALAENHTLRFLYPNKTTRRADFRIVKVKHLHQGTTGQWLAKCYDVVKKEFRDFTIAKMFKVKLPGEMQPAEHYFRASEMKRDVLPEILHDDSIAGTSSGAMDDLQIPDDSQPESSSPVSRPGGVPLESSGARVLDQHVHHSNDAAAPCPEEAWQAVIDQFCPDAESHTQDISKSASPAVTHPEPSPSLLLTTGETHPPRPDDTFSSGEDQSTDASAAQGMRLPTVRDTPAAVPPHHPDAGRIRALVVQSLPGLEAGKLLTVVAEECGVSVSKLSKALSLEGRLRTSAPLLDRARYILTLPLHDIKAAPQSRSKDEWQRLIDDTPNLKEHLAWLYFQTMKASSEYMTHARHTGSKATALRRLGDWEPLIQIAPDKATLLRDGSQPAALLRELRRITPGIEARVRGGRHTQLHTVTGRRSLTIRLEDGMEIPIEPGKVWVFDDASDNFPFWFELPAALRESLPSFKAHPMIARHGVGVGRQTLNAMDVGSSAWLGTTGVGRVRDSYTSALILRFFRQLMTEYGKPDWIILEHGAWASKRIKGWETPDGNYAEDEFEAIGASDEECNELQQGLAAMGVRLHYVFSPHGPGKALLESSFRTLQSVQGTFFQPGEGVNIGSHAGEYERAAKRMNQARDGVAHARALGFVHIERSADVRWSAMQWLNEKAKESRDNKRPIDLLQAGPERAALTQKDMATFLPELRPLMIRGGHVWPRANGKEFSFIEPQLFATLGDGERVCVKFDPAEPSLGAAIYSMSGKYLGWASLHEDAPMISVASRRNDEGLALINEYRSAERTAYRGYHLPTLKTVRASEVRDGTGNVATVTNGQTMPTQKPEARSGKQRFTATPEEFAKRGSRLERMAKAYEGAGV